MTTRAELFSIINEGWDDFLARPPAHAWDFSIRMTSGTTDKGPLVTLRERHPADARRFPGLERVLVCFGTLNIRLGYAWLLRLQDEEVSKSIMTLDAKDFGPALQKHLDEFRPDCIVGFPSMIGKIADHFSKTTAGGVKSLQISGELITDIRRSQLKKLFPHAEIAVSYIMNETGPISGPPCRYLERNRYHPAEGVIVTLKNVDERGAGELLVSKKLWGKVAVDRYETGDMAIIYTRPCACGMPITFEILGRIGYDYVKIAGAIVRHEEFDRVMRRYKQYLDYRVEVRESGLDASKGELLIKLYPKGTQDTAERAEELAREISQEVFLTPTKRLEDLVQQKIFEPLKIEFVNEPFPHKHKDVKIVRL